MYEVKPTGQFKKDLKAIAKRGYNMDLITEVIKMLSLGEQLPEKCKDHSLIGNRADHRECHIMPDWFLIYKVEADILILTLTRTGTHSDLF